MCYLSPCLSWRSHSEETSHHITSKRLLQAHNTSHVMFEVTVNSRHNKVPPVSTKQVAVFTLHHLTFLQLIKSSKRDPPSVQKCLPRMHPNKHFSTSSTLASFKAIRSKENGSHDERRSSVIYWYDTREDKQQQQQHPKNPNKNQTKKNKNKKQNKTKAI